MPPAPQTELSQPTTPTTPEKSSGMKEVQVDGKPVLDLSEPSQEVMDYARNVLGETEQTKTRTLQELKDLIYGEDE